ncbi:exosome 3'-_5 exonuclease subunit ski4 (Csl4) [Coniochaeta pulveracea]|uniref:Exosome 3'->5 exonuclease subunit ski4 (Csl4) n=1 Tax=Coniochaeta pulveracea TaxID=177199 RepID=A0A420Y1X5_9PEZI|nr:exosome 3'->5 exonuclease subunit ski4 (Csl4) [Coniochaeta pulveracea]
MMSSTTTVTVTNPPSTNTQRSPPQTMSLATGLPEQHCPNCDYTIQILSPSLEQAQSALQAAQSQIEDLQSQVRLLNEKASAAVDRWADYEDELALLRSQLEKQNNAINHQQRESGSSNTTVSTATSPGRSSFLPAGAANRLSALLGGGHGRKPLPATPPRQLSPLRRPGRPVTPNEGTEQARDVDELMVALSREQFLRREAEGRLSETSKEVEELSVSLFEQANEMVATERRARAELEKRIEELERRDRDRCWRLERLESCCERIEHVRGLLREVEEVRTDGEKEDSWIRETEVDTVDEEKEVTAVR